MQTQNAIRKAFAALTVVATTAGLCACGDASGGIRFADLADRVAAIPLDEVPANGREAGLRSAPEPLRVAVMDPHAMWEARDDMVGSAVAQAAPVVVETVVEEARARVVRTAADAGLRPAAAPAAEAGRLIQLGAFSSESAARAAWARLSAGDGAYALSGLQPVLETAEVAGRNLVRLKVRAPAGSAAAVCAAARIDDPWCHRAG